MRNTRPASSKTIIQYSTYVLQTRLKCNSTGFSYNFKYNFKIISTDTVAIC